MPNAAVYWHEQVLEGAVSNNHGYALRGKSKEMQTTSSSHMVSSTCTGKDADLTQKLCCKTPVCLGRKGIPGAHCSKDSFRE